MPPVRAVPSLLAASLVLAACAPDALAPRGAAPAPLAASRAASRAAGPSVQFVAERDAEELTTLSSGIVVYKSGLGSAMALGRGARTLYLLTDRGPNVDGPLGATQKVFPDPQYAPRIYRAHVAGNTLRIDGETPLRRPDGSRTLTGLPIPNGTCGSTLEAALDVHGHPIAPDPFGLDSEGLVAMDDGTFWVSDEYGPFIAHYAADGRELERLGPCASAAAKAQLPAVYARRRANRGMEGLTITPDGRTLVGVMQSPLDHFAAAPSVGAHRNAAVVTRILLLDLASRRTREYVYLLDSPTVQGNSEILALSATRFLVLERDGNFLFGTPRATLKALYEIDLAGATEVSALGAEGARPFAGGTKTLDEATRADLAAAGVVPVAKRLAVDLLALGYPHDKPEGLALAPGGKLFVANDDDFGIVVNTAAMPNTALNRVQQKFLPGTSPLRPDASTVWQLKLP